MAFPQCSGLDCDELLPCEIKRRERRREVVRLSQQRRRARARFEGLCVCCATRPARPGMKTCAQCIDTVMKSQKKKAESKAE